MGILKTFQGGLPEIFHIGTLEAVYQHWESCTSLSTYSKVNIPDYHSLEEFSITKAYANWYIRACNPDKEILTIACMEPPSNSSQQIPSKSLESRTCKVDSSVSTKGNIIDNVEKDFDDLPNDSRASSKPSMGGHQTNTSTHLECDETIFNGGNGHCHKTLNNITMHRVFMYQTTTLKIQVNVTLNTKILDPTLYTMMRLTLILLMQMSFLLTSQLLLNQWNLMVKRFVCVCVLLH